MTVADLVRPAAAGPNRMMITITVMVATIMQVLDTTIANVALPHMQGSLGATQDQILWVLTSYIIAAAIMTPITGWMASRLGRRRLFVISLTGFTAASVLCGLAGSLSEIVLFRILQGVFGAALVPLSQALMLDTYPRHEHGRAMSIWSMGVMVGPILGPVAGGYLTDEYSWRWCFYINLPLGILAVLGALAFIPETARAPDRKLDRFGFAFLALAVASLQLVLDRGEQKGWFESTEVLAEAALAIFSLYMFVVHSATTARPFFDTRLFKDRTFIISTFILSTIFIVYYGSLALAPQMLQNEMNYPVLTAGMVSAPRGAATIIGILLAARIRNMVDPRWLIGTGMLVSSIGMYLMSTWSLSIAAPAIIAVGMVQGVGQGLINAQLTTIAFSTLPSELRTEASGFFNLMRNLGSAFGVSISGAQLAELIQTNHSHLAEFITPEHHVAGIPGVTGQAAMQMLNLDITRQAGMVAYINVYWLLAILSFAVIPLVFLLRVPKNQPSGEPLPVGE